MVVENEGPKSTQVISGYGREVANTWQLIRGDYFRSNMLDLRDQRKTIIDITNTGKSHEIFSYRGTGAILSSWYTDPTHTCASNMSRHFALVAKRNL